MTEFQDTDLPDGDAGSWFNIGKAFGMANKIDALESLLSQMEKSYEAFARRRADLLAALKADMKAVDSEFEGMRSRLGNVAREMLQQQQTHAAQLKVIYEENKSTDDEVNKELKLCLADGYAFLKEGWKAPIDLAKGFNNAVAALGKKLDLLKTELLDLVKEDKDEIEQYKKNRQAVESGFQQGRAHQIMTPKNP